jgi:hypothetical protein
MGLCLGVLFYPIGLQPGFVQIKTTLRFHFISVEWLSLRAKTVRNAGEDEAKQEPIYSVSVYAN